MHHCSSHSLFRHLADPEAAVAVEYMLLRNTAIPSVTVVYSFFASPRVGSFLGWVEASTSDIAPGVDSDLTP